MAGVTGENNIARVWEEHIGDIANCAVTQDNRDALDNFHVVYEMISVAEAGIIENIF